MDMKNIAFAAAALFFSSMASIAVNAETFVYSGGGVFGALKPIQRSLMA